MAYYKDLREHIKTLEEKGKLIRVTRQINKDTELHPLVRWQFRGLPERDRKAFFFENVVDVKGRKYDIPVLVACHAASREIYALGLQCGPDDIMKKWLHAESNPILPVMVQDGPVHEEVFMGDRLLERGGLEELPIPISTPGFDNAPYLTAANFLTKDPETGVHNIGNYRAMIKSRTRTGINAPNAIQHLRTHWEKCRARGVPLQAAIILGATPNIGFVAAAKLPYSLDEYAVAGGIAGEPVPLVKCKTVDLAVPATAEIVLEGIIPTDSLEKEGAFGEYSGYIGAEQFNPYFNLTCITHRKKPIFNAFLSQFPPSESSKLRGISIEAVYTKLLKQDCNLPCVIEVAFPEYCGSQMMTVVRMEKGHSVEAWRALMAVASYTSGFTKIIVAVDDDIDPRDSESVCWAMSFRMQPHRDILVVPGRTPGLDPSGRAPGLDELTDDGSLGALLINATMKWDFPPISLPRKDLMENARQIWEELGLPQLSPKVPWFGYELGRWTEKNRGEAELALKGDHYVTGEELEQQRRKV